MLESNQIIFYSGNTNQSPIKRGLLTWGPKLWKILPQNIKTTTPLSKFWEYIKLWFRPIHKIMKIYIGSGWLNHVINTAPSLYFKYFISSATIGCITTTFLLLTWWLVRCFLCESGGLILLCFVCMGLAWGLLVSLGKNWVNMLYNCRNVCKFISLAPNLN